MFNKYTFPQLFQVRPQPKSKLLGIVRAGVFKGQMPYLSPSQKETNKYERYYGPGRCLLAYLLYYMHTVSAACA